MMSWESRSLHLSRSRKMPLLSYIDKDPPEIHEIYKKREDVEQRFVATKNEIEERTFACRMMSSWKVSLRDFSLHIFIISSSDHRIPLSSDGVIRQRGYPEGLQNIHGQEYGWWMAVQGCWRYQRSSRNSANTLKLTYYLKVLEIGF